MEEITDAVFVHAKKFVKNFEIKSLGEYHDLHVRSNTLLLANILNNIRDICLKIYEPDPAKYLSAPGLASKAALKRLK